MKGMKRIIRTRRTLPASTGSRLLRDAIGTMCASDHLMLRGSMRRKPRENFGPFYNEESRLNG
jgi:hypothetical protein